MSGRRPVLKESQCRTRGDEWIGVGGFGNWSPEATHVWDDAERIMQFAYTAPLTNKLLLEAGFSQYLSNWGGQTPAGGLDYAPFFRYSPFWFGALESSLQQRIAQYVVDAENNGLERVAATHLVKLADISDSLEILETIAQGLLQLDDNRLLDQQVDAVAAIQERAAT